MTHLDIKYPALEVVDVPSLVKACTGRWYNQTFCKVNNSVVRLGVTKSEALLKRSEENDRSELTLRVNNYSDAICHYHAANSSDKCRFPRSLGTNSDPVGLTSHARTSNIDIVIACDEI